MAKEAHEEIIHEHTLFAEPVLHIGNFNVTNSLINSWLAVLILVAVAFNLKKRRELVPRGLQNFFETILEFFLGILDMVTGNREKSYRYLPLIFSFFVFILLNNWLGLLPGIGSIGKVVVEKGEKVFIPFFRGGTADINGTIGLAIFGVIASHIFGVIALGGWRYLNKFVNLEALADIPRKIKKEPLIILSSPINIFIGIVEIVGEISKIASLSFRLFGNIFAGEVLLASIAALFAFGAPIPFLFLEILVGLIQASVFSILILSYIAMATFTHEH